MRWPLILWLALAGIASAAERIEWRGVIFHIQVTDPSRIELHWQDEHGRTFRQFSTLQKHLESRGRHIDFMMNGGLFEEDGSPCGLLVIGGKTLRPLNLRDGVGNFYLQPNGVFYIDSTGAHIVPSTEYQRLRPAAQLAIQSGPLLLFRDRIHRAFRPASTNELHRNGVGIRHDGKVLFAITEFDQQKRVNLHQFAEFFRAHGCADALFLDGDLSQMVTDVKSPITPGNYFGTIFTLTSPAR